MICPGTPEKRALTGTTRKSRVSSKRATGRMDEDHTPEQKLLAAPSGASGGRDRPAGTAREADPCSKADRFVGRRPAPPSEHAVYVPPTAPPAIASPIRDSIAAQSADVPEAAEQASVVLKPDICRDMRATIQMDSLERQPTMMVPAASRHWPKKRSRRRPVGVFLGIVTVGAGLAAWLLLGTRVPERNWPWTRQFAGAPPPTSVSPSAGQNGPTAPTSSAGREASTTGDRRRIGADTPSPLLTGSAFSGEQPHLSITTAEGFGKSGSAHEAKPPARSRPPGGKMSKTQKHSSAQAPASGATDRDFDALDFDPKKK